MPNGVQAARHTCASMLLRPGRYRRKWEQYAERSRLRTGESARGGRSARALPVGTPEGTG